MARSSCHGFGGAKQRRLERLVRRQRYDSPGNTTSTRALCPPKPHGPGAPALNPPRMLAEATRSTARCDTLHNPPEGDRDSPPRRAKTRTRPKPSVTQPGTTRRENPGCPMGACANQRDTAQPKPTTVSSLTLELSRLAKQGRLERLVRHQRPGCLPAGTDRLDQSTAGPTPTRECPRKAMRAAPQSQLCGAAPHRFSSMFSCRMAVG